MLEPFAMFRLLPVLFTMRVSANAATQHPTPKKPCACEPELILLTEHTDVQYHFALQIRPKMRRYFPRRRDETFAGRSEEVVA